MVKRRDLKAANESAVLWEFSKYMEKIGNTFNVLETPDPPDAIIKINGRKTWLEITDVFISRDHAISLTTGASEDRELYQAEGNFFFNFDKTFPYVFQSAIKKNMIEQV